MKKIYNYKSVFTLLGLMLATTAVINTIVYEGINGYRYFTNQSNFLVLIVFILIYFKQEEAKAFKIISFVTLISISITGVVFHLLLTNTVGNDDGIIRTIYDINNWQNLLTHTINPLFYAFYYFVFVVNDLKVKDFWFGMIHPILYFIVILVLSPLTNFYPYPFLDVSQNGIIGVLKTTLLIMLPLITLFIVIITSLKYLLNKKIEKIN